MEPIPTTTLAILGAAVVLVVTPAIIALSWCCKHLLSQVLPEREKDHIKLLAMIQDFYDRQFKEEREVCLDNYKKIQEGLVDVVLLLKQLLHKSNDSD